MEQQSTRDADGCEVQAAPGSVFSRPHFWRISAVTFLVGILVYLPDLFFVMGRQIPDLVIDFVSRDIRLLCIPIPVFYAAHFFRTRGVIVVGAAVVLLFLPHFFLAGLSATSLLRMVVFTLFSVVLGLLYAHAWNKRHEASQMYCNLLQSEERLRDFLDNAVDIILSVDTQGRFLFVNRAWQRLLGYSREEAARMTAKDIVHPDYLERQQQILKRVLAGEDVGLVEMVFVAKDGNNIFVEGSVNAEIVQGSPVRTRSIFRDVTARRRAECDLRASESRYRDLFEHSHEALYTTSRDGYFLDVNPAMAEMLGYTREELSGVEVATTYADPADRDSFRADVESGGTVTDYPAKLKKKDGTVLDCLITAIVWAEDDNVVRGYQGIIRPVGSGNKG